MSERRFGRPGFNRWDGAAAFEWMGERYWLVPANRVPWEDRKEALTPDEGRWVLTGLTRDPLERTRFISVLEEVGPWLPFWSRVSDQELLAFLTHALKDRRVLVLKDREELVRAELRAGDLSDQGAVVEAAMQRRAWIRFEGQDLALLDTALWLQTRGKVNMRILGKAEALPLLQRLAQARGVTPARRAAFERAAELLTDNRVPLATSGLVLAQRTEVRRIASAPSEPAVTPSQLVKPAEDETLSITVERHYHDDAPIIGAPFELQFPGGAVIKGTLGSNGKATVNGVPESTAVARFGPDQRAYAPVPQPKNPSFKPTMNPPDFDALVDKYWEAGT